MRLPSLLLLAAPASAGQVWIVDAQLGPGAQHATVQSAVQAASDGDVILVRTGHYPAFQIGAKSLAIVGDTQAVVEIDGPLRVTHQTASAFLLVQGLSFTSAPFQSPTFLSACAGQVRLEKCSFTTLNFGWGQLPYGLRLEQCASVVLAGCSVRGSPAGGASGGHGLYVDASNVYAYGSSFEGANLDSGGTVKGGSGAVLQTGSLYAVDSSFQGGKGSDAVWLTYSPGMTVCKIPGDGGDGLLAANSSASAQLQACILAGGPSGLGNTTCTGGSPGVAIGPGAGQVVQTSVPSHAYSAGSPVRGGQQLALGFAAPAGELVLVAFSASAVAQPAFGGLGVLLVGTPWVLTSFGPLGPPGTLSVSIAIANPGGGVQGVALSSQAVFVSPGSAAVVLGPPASVVVLDASVP